MACQRDVIYWYDGTFEGFLCCVFESYANREIPWDIWYYATRQSSLFPGVDVQTDMVRAQRVLKSIREKLGQRVYYMVVRGFLNGDEGKEIRLLRFLRLMYDKGPQAAYQTGAPEVADVVQLARAVANEACQFKQFIRFEEREAPAYNEAAVLESRRQKAHSGGGCPGHTLHSFRTAPAAAVSGGSQLAQWPCQLRLVPVNAPYFQGADLLIAADCSAYAYADFHSGFMAGKITLIGCPKLDEGDYTEKLTVLLRSNDIRSVTVTRM